MTDDVKALIDEARDFNAATLAMVEVGVSSEHKLAVLASRCEGAMQRIDRLATALSTAESAGYERGVEEAARVVDECNREGPYQAIGAASRIRALKTEQPK